MRYPKSETAEKHQRILIEASRLFREKGFNGVTVSQIMEATGLTHGPFYNHFKSKDALMAASIEYAASASLQEIATHKESPEAMVEYVQQFLSPAHRDSPGTGCLMSALGGEVRNELSTQKHFSHYLMGVIEVMTRHFPWPAEEKARGDSIRMLSSMVGAMVLARAVDSEELSQEILEEVRSAFR
jgi:TetR/AcrR family transcriptional repressor of nem operon